MLKQINIFLFLFFVLISGCSQQKEENDTVDVNPPGVLTYSSNELVLERYKPLDFIYPEVQGEKLRYKIEPALPKGLILNSYTGTIAGIPAVTSSKNNYLVTVYNTAGQSSFNISIEISAIPIPEIEYSPSRYELPIGQEIELPILLTKSGATYTGFTINSPLPNGLIFNETDGSVSGTPTEFVPNSLHTIRGSTTTGVDVFASLLIQILDYPPSELIFLQNGNEATNFIQNRNQTISPITPQLEGGNVELFSIQPELPAGLQFNSLTGEISGTPVNMQLSTSYRITASNSGGSVFKDIFIEVKDIPPTNLTYNQITISLRKTIPINNQIIPTYSGGQIASFSIQPALPAGLLFNPANGEISGTPAEVSPIIVYTVTGSNNGGSTSTEFNLFVRDLPPQNLSYPIVSEIYVKNTPITSLSPTHGGGTVLNYSVTPNLPNGITLNPTTGVISGTPLEVSDITSYVVRAANSEGQAPYVFFLAVKDEAPINLTYPNTMLIFEKDTDVGILMPSNEKGAINSYSTNIPLPPGLELNPVTGRISGVPTTVVSENIYRITGVNATGEASVDLRIIVNDKAPINLTYEGNSFLFDRGVPISDIHPTYEGGLITEFRLATGSTLPSGLNLDTSTGVISGVPGTRILSSSTVIEGLNSGGITNTTLSFEVNDYAPSNISYGQSQMIFLLGESLGVEGVFPSNEGGAIDNYSVSPALPQGLFLDTDTGAIKGVPENPNGGSPENPIGLADLPASPPYNSYGIYTVSGFNSGGSNSKNIEIRITPPRPVISLPPMLIIQRDEDFEGLTPVITGGLPTEFIIEPTTLPPGLTFNSTNGAIEGIPTQVVPPTSYLIRVRNDGGNSNASIIIQITEIPPSGINYSSFMTDFVGDDNHYIYNNEWFWNSQVLGTSSLSTLAINECSYERGSPFDGTKLQIKRTCLGDNDFQVFKFMEDGLATYPAIRFVPAISGGPTTLWSIDKPLPSGLVFNNTTGEISGIPTEGTADVVYTISAQNEGGSTSRELKLKIADVPPGNLTYTEEEYQFNSGDLIIIEPPTYTGGEIIDFTITPELPIGLDFDETEGSIFKEEGINVQQIQGTLFTVQGCNNEGCVSTTFTLTILPDAPKNIKYGSEEFYDDMIYFTIGDFKSYLPVYDGGMANEFIVNSFLGITPNEDFMDDRLEEGANLLNLFVVDPSTFTLQSLGLSYNSTTGQLSGNISSYPSSYLFMIAVEGENESIDPSQQTESYIFINRKPIAHAGADFEGTIYDLLSLDGRLSSDPDTEIEWNFTSSTKGKEINYTWRLISKPASSSLVNVSNPNSAEPTFIPDAIGNYVFGLSINDGLSDSAVEDSITVYIKDVAPAPFHYGTQFTVLGQNKFLYHNDGSTNFTLTPIPSGTGGQVVSYTISPSLPAGLNFNTSTGVISGSVSQALTPTNYLITGTNTGGSSSSTITLFFNERPIAQASGPTKSTWGSQITLSAAGSYDPDGNVLETAPYNFEGKVFTYTWSIKTIPTGSTLLDNAFVDRFTASPKILPDVKGDYVFQLIVSDGYLVSSPVEVMVQVGTPPSNISFSDSGAYFVSGSNFAYNLNQPINILISFDGDSTAELGLVMNVSSLPSGLSFSPCTKRITGSLSSNLEPTSFSVNISNKGGEASSSFNIWVNATPTVNVNNPLMTHLEVGETILGDASPTTDVDGYVTNNAPYTSLVPYFDWSVLALPSSSTKQDSDLINKTTANVGLETDVPGIYLLNVRYFDGLIFSANDSIIRRETVDIPEIDKEPIAKVSNSFSIDVSSNAVGTNLITYDEEEDVPMVILSSIGSQVFKGSITYLWELVSAPADSTNEISNPYAEETVFMIDEIGTYQFKLTVSDGTDSSSTHLFVVPISASVLNFDIDSHHTLNKENSPYILVSDININNGAVLTIEEGVVIHGGEGRAININNGTINSVGSSNVKNYLNDVRITNKNGSISNINIRNNYTKNISLCPYIENVTTACSGSLELHNNVFLNMKGEQKIMANSSEMNIKNNVFINSEGITVESVNTPINVEENFVHNSLGLSPSDRFFMNVGMNTNEKIVIEKNRFSNPNSYTIIKNLNNPNEKPSIRYNYWEGTLNISTVRSRIANPNSSIIVPFVTTPFDTIPDGRGFLP